MIRSSLVPPVTNTVSVLVNVRQLWKFCACFQAAVLLTTESRMKQSECAMCLQRFPWKRCVHIVWFCLGLCLAFVIIWALQANSCKDDCLPYKSVRQRRAKGCEKQRCSKHVYGLSKIHGSVGCAGRSLSWRTAGRYCFSYCCPPAAVRLQQQVPEIVARSSPTSDALSFFNTRESTILEIPALAGAHLQLERPEENSMLEFGDGEHQWSGPIPVCQYLVPIPIHGWSLPCWK